jgi:hypothetical protein
LATLPTVSRSTAADPALISAVPPFSMVAFVAAFGTPLSQLPAVNRSPIPSVQVV